MARPRRHRVGEPRLPRLGHDGSTRQPRSAQLLEGRSRRGGPSPGLAHPPLPAGRRHDLQRRSAGTATRTTSGPTTWRSGPSRAPATRPGTRSSWRPSTAAPARPPMPAVWRRGPRPSCTSRPSRRPCARRCARRSRRRQASFWSPPEDATPEQLAEFEAFMARMLVPDESITTWIDISGDPLERKWAAIQRARHPDRRRQLVHALRPRRLARAVVEGGLHPARVDASRRPRPRTTCSRDRLGDRPPGPDRRPDYQGSRPPAAS